MVRAVQVFLWGDAHQLRFYLRRILAMS